MSLLSQDRPYSLFFFLHSGLAFFNSIWALSPFSVYNFWIYFTSVPIVKLIHHINLKKVHFNLFISLCRYLFMSRESTCVPQLNPEWSGRLFDLWDDISLAYLSIFCTCVFGWNMDRLGFGNMYVHIVTFLLFCLAPFFIFNLAAVNIDVESVRTSLGLTGFVLCIFGLLYGGFWRIQMRRRFNLPGSKFCLGKEDLTDCFQWLCCCFCSLAQEVRTGDFYDVVENKLYYKEMDDVTGGGPSSNQTGVMEKGSTRPLQTSGAFLPRWQSSEGSQRDISSAIEPPFVAVILK
jgi:Cys-rich protein (TIGR01571 family)